MEASRVSGTLTTDTERVHGRWSMKGRRIWEIGGFVAGAVLIVFGVVAIFLGVSGYNTTRDALKDEGITFGTADDPAVAEHAEQWAGEQVTTGDQARAFALVMREHTLESTDGLTYAQMGRFQSEANPGDPAGTNDEAAALKDEGGEPVANGARNIWVTETALTTALNMSYMAEQLALFGMVVGVALLLAGVGFIILTLSGALRREKAAGRAPASTATIASA
jgi:hypothetical protein